MTSGGYHFTLLSWGSRDQIMTVLNWPILEMGLMLQHQ